MLQKLKRHAIFQLALTIFLTLSLLMTTYYFFYNRILSQDYIDKASSLSEIYSQNVNNYLKQLDKNTSTFINYFDISTYKDLEQPEFRLHIANVLSSIMKYQINEAITDIIIMFDDENYIANNPYIINMEAIKQTGILEVLKNNASCVYYDPDIKIFLGNNNIHKQFLYGKTIYDLGKNSALYVVEVIDVDKFIDKIREESYFMDTASIYIKMGNSYLTVAENNKTKLNLSLLSNGKPLPQKRNVKTVSMHNMNYNIDVITSFTTKNFISYLKNIFILLCFSIGILGLIFSKKIIEHIVYPLEKIYVKINKSTFKES